MNNAEKRERKRQRVIDAALNWRIVYYASIRGSRDIGAENLALSRLLDALESLSPQRAEPVRERGDG